MQSAQPTAQMQLKPAASGKCLNSDENPGQVDWKFKSVLSAIALISPFSSVKLRVVFCEALPPLCEVPPQLCEALSPRRGECSMLERQVHPLKLCINRFSRIVVLCKAAGNTSSMTNQPKLPTMSLLPGNISKQTKRPPYTYFQDTLKARRILTTTLLKPTILL